PAGVGKSNLPIALAWRIVVVRSRQVSVAIGWCLARFCSEMGTVSMVITGTYDPYLVALSFLVACFASYTALDLGGRVAPVQGPTPRIWLAAAALTLGGGIWSMHF